MQPLKILTWHVHGSYLFYLAQGPHHFYLPVKAGRPEGYGGRCGPRAWPETLHEVPAEQVRELDLDVILYQSQRNWREDQQQILSPQQQQLPRIFLEHDPPREHPTDTRHPVQDPNVLLVHVTAFNELMWDSGPTPTRVIDHGVLVPEGVLYRGELPRGISVVNGLAQRGRRLGADIFAAVRQRIPLDLVGMRSEELGGLGELSPGELAACEARYRFFFNPIRYTSLGLAVCEAMMIGMPIVGLATTEMAVTIQNGVCGFVETRVERLVEHMQALLEDAELARRLGEAARHYAQERFDIRRFVRDWNEALLLVHGGRLRGHGWY